MNKIRPTLWFDTQAEDAARFYTSVFKNSRMGRITRYPAVGQEITGKAPGSVMTVEFELNGQPFLALNGGSAFQLNEAVSFEVPCEDQAELDYYWNRLGEGSDPSSHQCGWLKDKFGLSWQITPRELDELLASDDRAASERAFAAMLDMKKLDIGQIRAAYEGKAEPARR